MADRSTQQRAANAPPAQSWYGSSDSSSGVEHGHGVRHSSYGSAYETARAPDLTRERDWDRERTASRPAIRGRSMSFHGRAWPEGSRNTSQEWDRSRDSSSEGRPNLSHNNSSGYSNNSSHSSGSGGLSTRVGGLSLGPLPPTFHGQEATAFSPTSSLASWPATPLTSGTPSLFPMTPVGDQPPPEFGFGGPDPRTTEQLLEERRARRAAILAKYATLPSQPEGMPTTPTSSYSNTSAFPGHPAMNHPNSQVPPHRGEQVHFQRSGEAPAGSNINRQTAVRPEWARGTHGGAPVPDWGEGIDSDDDSDEAGDLFALSGARGPSMRAGVAASMHASHAADGSADEQGYYSVRLGETLDNGRFHVAAAIGKGMFSTVVRARDLRDPRKCEVAIKIVRIQEPMRKVGLKEIAILTRIQAADPQDKRHFVRLLHSFTHREHLCLVFESLAYNLREVLFRYGKDKGLNIHAVRAYASQLFISLAHLRKLNIVHADMKPENILVAENRAMLKVCDLGSANDSDTTEPMPYLVSRFYRAPEIILGLPYDGGLDVWSVGCTLFELYTGQILFPGRNNAQMMQLVTELRGRFNSKVLRRAPFAAKYFDDFGVLVQHRGVAAAVMTGTPRDLKARVMMGGDRLGDDDARLVGHFVDLLDKCLCLEPTRRITPKEALVHALFQG